MNLHYTSLKFIIIIIITLLLLLLLFLLLSLLHIGIHKCLRHPTSNLRCSCWKQLNAIQQS